MLTGPIAFTEAIYDKLRECNDDCGEYAIFGWGAFGDFWTARGNVCPVEETRLFYKDYTCALCPKRDYDINYLYGSDPMTGSWQAVNNNKYVYNDFCHNFTFKIAHIADKLFL